MKPITYIGKCGCYLSVGATIRKVGYSRVCRVHKELIVSAYRECLDCDAILKLKHTGKGPFRCEKHAQEKRSDTARNSYLRNKDKNNNIAAVEENPIPNKWSHDKRGDYCSGIYTCLKVGKLKCDGCDDFVGIFFGHDPAKLVSFKDAN